ncbi:PREDICTED: coiled-coil domain-containing protein 171 isoform X1 [Cyprinodon variegatus]|nr:PREDICTED: coiled-coil domain-containing protein 171 isoform X1 [Cyprinodon variegatus]XP_015250062.1 PREDICTED: coiled-coil domain-containing protein 171 isoform X1 [Cyprinodon variegatus]XP_015250063.1 PREDICTED: coiled-coil domain-containing protein 171 isoform X1 [Cyprinodon variegatus]
MRPGATDRSRQPSRCKRAERREAERRTDLRVGDQGSKEENTGVVNSISRQEKQLGGREEREEKEERVMERRASSEGRESSEKSRELRWRLNQLEKEKLRLTSCYNQEVCTLQAEVTRLRSSVERGEAQRAELQYQLAASRRDSERMAELTRDRHTLTEQAAELQQTVADLQKALNVTQQARKEDQQALQQDLEERDQLIQNFSSENQRLHQVLQDQEVALEETERKMSEVRRKCQREAEASRRQAEELKILAERMERTSREKELSDQRVKSLELSMEAERVAHLDAKYQLEVLQLRVRDLEAAVAVERSSQQEAQHSLELLRAHLREVERVYSLEKERRECTEHALERLQTELAHCKSKMTVALETERKATSELSKQLEEEKSRHASTQSLLQQAAAGRSETEEVLIDTLKRITGMLQQSAQPAKDDGKPSPAEVLQLLASTLSTDHHRLEETTKQVQDLLGSSQKLQEENCLLQQLISDQKKQNEEAQQALVQLQEEASGLRLQGSDWSLQNKELQEELQRVKEERMKEKEEIQEIREEFKKESEARLSFLHCLYQRLLAGCVLIHHPQSILGEFTWQDLCDVITQQVDQLTSDLLKANSEIAHLQGVCDKKSVCVRELQRSQESVLARLEESVRRREEAWSRQHTDAVSQLQSQLQLCRSQCNSHRDRASSLEQRCSSLTSDLSRLQGLLSKSRRESSSFFLGCALLAGALQHARSCVRALSEQKVVLRRQLAERELLEQEVRRLADALGGEQEEEEEERRRRAIRRWRRSAWAVLALKRWMAMTKRTMVLFRLERSGGGVAVCRCGDAHMASLKDELDEGAEAVCARWLRSKNLSSIILSSMVDLQRALANTGCSPPKVISAARSGFSCLLDRLLDQSAPSVSSGSPEEIKECSSLKLRQAPDLKTLVSALQQHFLLFSQRLHSTEVERRSLRLEVANLKRGLQQERAELNRTVPPERFQTACEELRQALNREQEAQTLIQEQSKQLQALSEARQQLRRKERSLRILGKHLSGVQKERKQLEEKMQRAEEQLKDAARCQEWVIRCMKAAEMSCKQVRKSLVQSQRSASTHRRPLLFNLEPLDLSEAKCLTGSPEVAACQSFLSVVSQLHHACSSRIDWLEQEVSAHRSHVTALRSELQDACLRESLTYFPVEELPEQPDDDDDDDWETRNLPPISGLSAEPL